METPRFLMSHPGEGAVPRLCPPRNNSPLKIVCLYADQPTQALAAGVLRGIAHNCSGVCKMNSDWLGFDMLEAATEREAAACAAADADMVWCAANAGEKLPRAVELWADLWSAHRSETECALVALLRCPAGYVIERSPARVYLVRLARAAGLELFVQRFDCDRRASVTAPSQPLIRNDSFPMESEPGRGQIHWGINE